MRGCITRERKANYGADGTGVPGPLPYGNQLECGDVSPLSSDAMVQAFSKPPTRAQSCTYMVTAGIFQKVHHLGTPGPSGRVCPGGFSTSPLRSSTARCSQCRV